MKNIPYRYRFSALWLIALLFISTAAVAQTELQQKLKEIPAITETRPLESECFAEKYVTYFTQPIDHRQPELGTFRQRVIVSHVGFDRPTLIITEGYDANWGMDPKYREELSEWLGANMVFVEHRYFDESTPEPRDWQYLTTENSADDLHAVRQAFGQIYTGKWISTGISKGGQTTLLYRTYYPDDVDLSVPYVAPLNRGVEDGRHEPFIRRISTPENRQRIEAYQTELLRRKAALMPLFKAHCDQKELRFRAPVEEIFDFCVLEYPFAFWQWGTPIDVVPDTTATDEELMKHLLYLSGPDYFIDYSPTTSFFVQAARELGYYGYDTRPFKQYLTIKTAKGYLHRLMLPRELDGMKFDKTLYRRITKFLKKNDPRMIFVYGENDPWTASGVTWLKGKQNLHVFVQPGGSHRARLSTLTEAQREEAMNLIRQWLEE